jgi:hypothetical protein
MIRIAAPYMMNGLGMILALPGRDFHIFLIKRNIAL